MTDRHTNTEVFESLQFNVLVKEDAKVLPFADTRTKAVCSPQLF